MVRRTRNLGVAAFLVSALLLTLVPTFAQADGPVVRILPINQAQFLPGTYFDLRVEVEAASLPEDFAVTINGAAVGEFFGVEGTEEAWEYGGRVARYVAEGTPAADFSVDSLAGEYYNSALGVATISVTDGVVTAEVGGETATLEPTDNPLVFTIVGGQADGLVLTFGLTADGVLTGFDVAGQQFGVLTSLPNKVSSVIWRGVLAPAAGEYTVEVTAGGAAHSVTWTVREPQPGDARNVILFIADGSSVGFWSAVRVVSRGYQQGTPNDYLVFETFESIGLAATSSVDSLAADSANTASSLNTGHIGSVNATGGYSDTSPNALDDPRVETFGQIVASRRGMSVGVVTTSDWTDATPAAVWAHGRNRSSSNRAAYAAMALDGGPLPWPYMQDGMGLMPQVIFGGGGQYMIPNTVDGSRRGDDRDLFAEYEAAGYTIVTSRAEMDAAMAENPERVLGIFHNADMNVWLDRNVYTDNAAAFPDQPGLVEMTMGAIGVLSQNPNGFYLEVEAASVDKQLHPMDFDRAIADGIEFERAIAAAYEWAQQNAPDTLIVVTADHSHATDVWGTVNVERFNAATDDVGRRNAIGIYNTAVYPTYEDADGDFYPDDWSPSIVLAIGKSDAPPFTEDFQVSAVPRSPSITDDAGNCVDNPEDDPNGLALGGNLPANSCSSVHTVAEVPVYATGPGSAFFTGVYHQREIFFGMAAAIGLDPAAENGMMARTPDLVPANSGIPSEVGSAGLLLIGLVGGYMLARRRQKPVTA